MDLLEEVQFKEFTFSKEKYSTSKQQQEQVSPCFQSSEEQIARDTASYIDALSGMRSGKNEHICSHNRKLACAAYARAAIIATDALSKEQTNVFIYREREVCAFVSFFT